MLTFIDNKKYVLMSIKPAYAEHIKNGRKTVELRRVLPRIEAGDMIIVYESAPIQRITMTCIVEKTLSCETDKLWRGFGQEACIDYEAFKKYFAGQKNCKWDFLEILNYFPSR